MKAFPLLLLLFLVFIWINKCSNSSDQNLYIIHHHTLGELESNYLNSRDDIDGDIEFVDANTKERKWIKRALIDSVTVINENFWLSGPRDKNLKYSD